MAYSKSKNYSKVVIGRSWFGSTGVLWRVCWAGDNDDSGFVAHYGPLVLKQEAERRMAWEMKQYPHVIYWLEQGA